MRICVPIRICWIIRIVEWTWHSMINIWTETFVAITPSTWTHAMTISDENFLAIGYMNTPWESNFMFSSSSFCFFLAFCLCFSYNGFQIDARTLLLSANHRASLKHQFENLPHPNATPFCANTCSCCWRHSMKSISIFTFVFTFRAFLSIQNHKSEELHNI